MLRMLSLGSVAVIRRVKAPDTSHTWRPETAQNLGSAPGIDLPRSLVDTDVLAHGNAFPMSHRISTSANWPSGITVG